MARYQWTTERDAELNRLWETHSASQIGAILGVSRNAIIGRYHRLKGDYREQNEARAAAGRAETAATVAKHKALEDRIIQEMKRRIASGTDRNRAIFMARKNGAYLQTIGDSLGITRERVRQIEEMESV